MIRARAEGSNTCWKHKGKVYRKGTDVTHSAVHSSMTRFCGCVMQTFVQDIYIQQTYVQTSDPAMPILVMTATPSSLVFLEKKLSLRLILYSIAYILCSERSSCCDNRYHQIIINNETRTFKLIFWYKIIFVSLLLVFL